MVLFLIWRNIQRSLTPCLHEYFRNISLLHIIFSRKSECTFYRYKTNTDINCERGARAGFLLLWITGTVHHIYIVRIHHEQTKKSPRASSALIRTPPLSFSSSSLCYSRHHRPSPDGPAQNLPILLTNSWFLNAPPPSRGPSTGDIFPLSLPLT